PHHLIDIIPPEHPVTLAQFKEMADERIQNILSRGKLPILVGGTGLYLDSLVYNFDLQKEKVQPTLRKKLQELDLPSLQEMLISLSPETLNEMTESDQKNPHRLMRAIERISQGKRVPYDRGEKKYKTLYLVISPDPDALEKNIRDRLHRMLEMGLEEENKRLRDRGLDSKSSPLNSIGYREFDDYFAGTQSLDETEALITIHTRQYARRQMTWFKRNPDVVWVDGLDEAMAHVKPFLGKDRT
ncbi:MAG: tRNA (adenosine(37)-N6)-dimethylallyltransferase MiaA, partial [Candidatus Dojkabacteria bacterium]|nr:tRNA (adenosine(37)-N6)-dimethylallyltransferase MiaA [Candidatus Dojkabacteria bacterium]